MGPSALRAWGTRLLPALLLACGTSPGPAGGSGVLDASAPADGSSAAQGSLTAEAGPDGDTDESPAPIGPASWVVTVDPTTPGRTLSPALLGQYDLAGSLWHYDQVPGLVAGLAGTGFAEWRVSVERWEGRSEMFPLLSDGVTACTYPEPTVFVPAGCSDLDLLHARDWFVDDGNPVTLADTQDDARYSLAYARSVIDVARAFGADSYVSIDAMPRALSLGKTPVRTDCYWSFWNGVTNAPPADPAVFAAAAVGLVKRIVEGSGGEPGRPVKYFELWNEPDGGVFWDPSLDPDQSRFWAMAQQTLTSLAAYRASSSHPELRFALGSFTGADAAIAAIQRLDPLNVPMDVIAFHEYVTDPIALAQQVERVTAAVRASTHYQQIEVAMPEWGPGPDIENNDESRLHPNLAYAASIAPALHVATVIARGANAGLTRAHHVFFWDFFPFRIRGLLQSSLAPRPQYSAFVLLASMLGSGAQLLPMTGASDTEVVLAVKGADGAPHVLLVNLGTVPEVARVDLAGGAALPSRIRVFDDPAGVIRDVAPTGPLFVAPAQSIVLVNL